MNKKLPYLYVSLSVLLWGSSAAVIKLLLENLNNLQILFYVSLFAFIGLFIISIFQKKINIIKKYKITDLGHFLGMGFIGVFLYYIFLFAGMTFAPAQEAFIVNYTWPIWVVIFAVIILKEKINKRKIIAIILGFIGVYIVASNGNLQNFEIVNIKGDLFAIAAAISYALFSVYGKKSKYDKTTSMMFYHIFTFILISILIGFVSEIPKVSTLELIGLIWLGAFSGGLGFLFWFLALKHGDTSKMSNIIFLTPFVSLVYIYFLLDEKILISSIIGLIIIVLGIIIQSLNKKSIK